MTTNGFDVPLHTLFIFFLIISGNYLGQLFPCKIQKVFTENVYLKHFFGFLTLTFFVLLIDSSRPQNFSTIFTTSIGLYFVFLLLMNTNVLFFILSILTLAIIYLIHIYQTQTNVKTDPETDPETNPSFHISNEWMTRTKDTLYMVFTLSTLVGLLVYMGEKKIEYGKKFNYLTFVFGKPSCRSSSPHTKLMQSFLAAFR